MTCAIIGSREGGTIMYEKLFSRGKIGNLELKNRIFKPAAQSTPCYDGQVSERLIRFYEEEAAGGTGLIIVGLARVSKHETPQPSGAIGIDTDEKIAGFGALAQAIHDNGAKCALQLAHFGSHAYPPIRCVSREGLEHDFWLPEHHPGMKVFPHQEYSVEEIQELVEFYGDAAVRAVKAGFDMIEVHAGHRHGLGMFVSPLTNHRKDVYGGSLENRTRIVFEVLENIKEKIGNVVPISVRLNGTDGEPGGEKIEDAVWFAKKLEAFGVDAINVSNQMAVVPMQAPLSVHTWAAAAVKKEIRIPVLSCGSNNTPEIAEEVIASGQADFVGTGRALFADPAWPKKAKTGHTGEIRPCIRCMECVGPKYSWVGPLACTVNPRVGKEQMLPLLPAETKKKIAVIGGGPAGLEAAQIAKKRGHDVTIYEKRKLSGRLNEAAVPPFKADLLALKQYYEHMTKLLEIPVIHMAADREEIVRQKYDAVILACGGKPIEIPVEGADPTHVYQAITVLASRPELGERIVVIGGGAIGIETAILLADQGKQVTVVEMLDEILGKEYVFTKEIYGHMLEEKQVQVLTSARIVSAREEGLEVLMKEETARMIPADDIVLAAGLRPDLSLREVLETIPGLEVICAGDCVKPRNLFDAIHEGNTAGRLI